eukprot:comp24490_c0_seq1/m.46744 comp24490_c0_seq1/g.46744  ORF comp24490_c0_seq1/g.46744 comp24490_c0_seq1/m.46744 type:complete len:288 (-) comp24490_c0_seq1:831-1694(-)
MAPHSAVSAAPFHEDNMTTSRPVVIVTGISKGIGEAVTRSLLSMGAHVVGISRSLLPLDLEDMQRPLDKSAPRLVHMIGDIAEESTCMALVARAISEFGRVDGLVNNAALGDPIARLVDASPLLWKRHIEVNAVGAMTLAHHALPYLRSTKGRIINVSSRAAKLPMLGSSAYCCAKAMVNMLTLCLAKEEPLVTSLVVYPGVVDTALQTKVRNAGDDVLGLDKELFWDLYRKGQLLRADQPGHSIAVLALSAPPALSGCDVMWNSDDVINLSKLVPASPAVSCMSGV